MFTIPSIPFPRHATASRTAGNESGAAAAIRVGRQFVAALMQAFLESGRQRAWREVRRHKFLLHGERGAPPESRHGEIVVKYFRRGH
jgi:hypothetical protein